MGGGGGPIAPPSGVTSPAAPEVLGSVTEAPGIDTFCKFNVALRFSGENADQANADGHLPYVIQATPGQAGFDTAVVENLNPLAPHARTPCPECKDRLLRVVDYGVFTAETIRPLHTTQAVPIDSEYGVLTYFSNQESPAPEGLSVIWYPKKIQDFSYDEAAQAYPLKNWLFQNKGMYRILLAPKGTEKVESPKEINFAEWDSLLNATEVSNGERCPVFAKVRELRILYPTATQATPSSTGIVHPADDDDDTPLYEFDSGSIRRIPFNLNLGN